MPVIFFIFSWISKNANITFDHVQSWETLILQLHCSTKPDEKKITTIPAAGGGRVPDMSFVLSVEVDWSSITAWEPRQNSNDAKIAAMRWRYDIPNYPRHPKWGYWFLYRTSREVSRSDIITRQRPVSSHRGQRLHVYVFPRQKASLFEDER